MINNKVGESLVGILIGVFILSVVILGIGSLIIYSNDISQTYKNNTQINLLRSNLGNVIKKIDTSKVKEKEIFYLYKNKLNNTFEVYTGAINQQYKYIDKLGNKVDNLATFQGGIYSRILFIEREDTSISNKDQIIKSSIKKLIKK